MRRILLAIWFYVFFVAFALAQNTTLTGTMTAPGGQPFTGYLWLSLSQVAISLSACGTPTYVLPNIPLEINVVNGNLIGTYVIWGDDCLNPSGDPYNVQIKDLNGNVLVTDQWLIQGSTFDVGTAVSALDNPIATSTGSGGGGTLGIGGGGTGATTAAGALTNLGAQINLGATQTGAIGASGTATFPGTVAAGTVSDGTASLYSGSLTGAVNGTFSGTVAAGSTILLTPLAGGADNTSFINTTLSTKSNVILGPGSWPITCNSTTDAEYRTGGIRPPTGTNVTLSAGATLTCAVNTTGYYNAFVLQNVSNARIEIEGVIEGNRTANLAAGAPTISQWGYGVVFSGCRHCAVTGTGTAQNFLGDGLIIDKDWVSGNLSTDLYIGPLLMNNSYRNGASVINLTGVATFDATRFNGSNGTAPQAGVDVEPGYVSNTIDTVRFIGVTATGNTGRGLEVQGPSGNGTINTVQVIGGVFDSNLEGIEAYGVNINHFSVSGAKISNSTQCGSYIQTTADGAVALQDNYYWGNSSSGSTTDCNSANAYFQTAAGFIFSGNVLRAGTNATKPVTGLQLNSNTGVNQVYNNDLAGSASTTTASNEFFTYSESGSDYYSQNRLTSGQQAAQNFNLPLGGYPTLAGSNVFTGYNAFTNALTTTNQQWTYVGEASLGTNHIIGSGAGMAQYSQYNGGYCGFENIGGTGSTTNRWVCGLYGANLITVDGAGNFGNGTDTWIPGGTTNTLIETSSGTQVAGQVACIKAVATATTPVIIGTCSGTVNATTGTCGTCN